MTESLPVKFVFVVTSSELTEMVVDVEGSVELGVVGLTIQMAHSAEVSLPYQPGFDQQTGVLLALEAAHIHVSEYPGGHTHAT